MGEGNDVYLKITTVCTTSAKFTDTLEHLIMHNKIMLIMVDRLIKLLVGWLIGDLHKVNKIKISM